MCEIKKTKNQCGYMVDGVKDVVIFNNQLNLPVFHSVLNNSFANVEFSIDAELKDEILIEFDEEERYGEKYVVESKKPELIFLAIDINGNYYRVGN